MNTIKELIEKYCPNGVEYKKLGEVAEIVGGRDYKHLSPGNIPVYGSGGVMTYVDDYAYNQPTVLLPRKGSISNVFYVDKPFWNVDTIFYTKIKDYLLPKYLYYYICNCHIEKLNTSNAARPALTRTVLNNILIPVPPLPVQREIVRILDSFTSLEAELEAELEARRKQYEYYRDQLLSFKHLSGEATDEVEWKTIKDVCLSICSGGTPNTQNKDFYNGNIPWLRTQEVDWKDIYKTDVLITEAGLKNSSAKLIPANCVIVAMYGATAAKVAINKIPLTTNQACCNLQIDESICNNRYVYQWLCKNYEVLKAMGEGSQQNLNAKKIKNFPIPIPPLSTQHRIVSILDRFESLVNDISTGLPAEIAARHQQYEYYRDQLLSFKRKS